jgi:hypothetical protein
VKSEYTIKSMTSSAKATLAYARKHGKQLRAVIKALEKAECGLTNAYMCASDMTVSVNGNIHQLALAWKALRRVGFKCESSRPKGLASSWSGWFRSPSEAQIFLQFSSTVCKRVKVGERTVTEPVYEIQCGS